MRGYTERSDVQIAKKTTTPSLADRLRAIGIVVPDQVKAARMKEAMRLGLKVTASDRRIRFAYWHKLVALMNTRIYVVYDSAMYDGDSRDYGGKMPDSIRADAESGGALSGVRVEVHAMYEDPWLVIADEHESLIIHGWYRDPRTREQVIVL